MTDKISEIFEISPMVEPEVVSKMVGSSEVLPPAPIQRPTPEQIIADFNAARKNILEVIETTKSAVEDSAELAHQSQDDKYIDSLAGMLKVMLEANRDLIDLHTKVQRITDEVRTTINKVNNNLFVGSTAELTKMLDDLRKKD